MDKVFCRDCAKFVIVHPESNGRIEASHEVRKTGSCNFLNHVGRPRSYVPTPVCHAGRRPAWNDWENGSTPEIKDYKQKFLDQISLGVHCDSFSPYEPGIGPKELDEMQTHQATIQVQKDLLSLQKEVFDWRRQQAATDQRFEQQLQALQQIRHNETIKVGESQASGTSWQAIWTLVACVISALALLVSAVIGWFTLFPRPTR